MTAPTTERIDRASYEAAVASVRAGIVAYAASFWASATLTDQTVDALTGGFAPAVEAAQLQVAALTSVYLAGATGTEPLPVGEVASLGRGVPNDVVYARPVITARALVAEGKPLVEAFRAGGRRLESLATTDIQMAKVRQADRSMAHAGVTHYRRVPRGAGTCAMCLIASTKRYNVGTLMEIHPGCDCDVDVLPDGEDLDDVLDVDLLNATHAKVKEFTGIEDRGGKAVDYRKLVITRDHGEIGPLVAWKGDHFEGPMDAVLGPAGRRSVFDSAPTTSRNRSSPRGANAPSFAGSDTPVSREDVNRNLADLLAGIEDV